MKTITHYGLVGDFSWKLPDHISGKVDEQRIADVIEDFLLVLLRADLRSEALDSIEEEVASVRVLRPKRKTSKVDMTLEVSMAARVVYVGGVDVGATPKEFAIIAAIYGKGRHVPIDEIVRSVYGDVTADLQRKNTVRTQIKTLRRKIAHINPHFDYIEASVNTSFMICQPD